jgi:hypothetical protein
MADYIDLITGKPLEPWAQQMMDRKDAQPEAARVGDTPQSASGDVKCAQCNGFGYFVGAPSTTSAGGERFPCGACQPAVSVKFATAPASSVGDGRLREAAARAFDAATKLLCDSMALGDPGWPTYRENAIRAALQPAAASEPNSAG